MAGKTFIYDKYFTQKNIFSLCISSMSSSSILEATDRKNSRLEIEGFTSTL